MRNAFFLFSLLAMALLFAGCPNGNNGKDPTTDGASDGEQPDDGKADGQTTQDPKDPLDGSLFDKDMLFEIYRGDMQGGEAKLAAHKKHRLADKDGKPLAARIDAYKRALQRYAEGDPEGWSAFLESLSK